MGILRRVDRSFVADYGFNARNDNGYIVDLLCPETDDLTTMKAGADLEATPMAGTEWLLAAPQFEQTIIGEDGRPLRIVVPEPRTFALHKLWVSKRDDRLIVEPRLRPEFVPEGDWSVLDFGESLDSVEPRVEFVDYLEPALRKVNLLPAAGADINHGSS